MYIPKGTKSREGNDPVEPEAEGGNQCRRRQHSFAPRDVLAVSELRRFPGDPSWRTQQGDEEERYAPFSMQFAGTTKAVNTRLSIALKLPACPGNSAGERRILAGNLGSVRHQSEDLRACSHALGGGAYRFQRRVLIRLRQAAHEVIGLEC